MKKVFTLISMALVAVLPLRGQDAQTAAAEAAAALNAAEDLPAKVEKPKYWNSSLLTNINLGETFLENWAAGGYNSVSLAANVDAQANYAREKMIWNNRLQLDYGFMYSADKPILQTTKDRIYFESKWGYETPVKHLSYSASFDFKTQFGDNFNYKTPTTAQFDQFPGDEAAAWREAAKNNLKSGFFAPAYINLGLGALWTPVPWFSLNLAPLTGGVVIVTNEMLRKTYGMELPEGKEDLAGNYKSSRFELGAQLKADMAWVINENFSYTTQLVLFSNYLKNPQNLRVNWDNKVFWKLRKFFALTVGTNLIYDDTIRQKEVAWDENGNPTEKVQAVQFKQFLEFGFTYSFTVKH